MYTFKNLLILLALMSASLPQAGETVSVYWEANSKGGYELYADNTNSIPYYLELSFTQLDNLTPNRETPYPTVLPPESKKNYLLSIDPAGKGKNGFKYAFSYFKGDPFSAKHKDDYLYLFPFAHGAKFRIDQGYNGASTHKGGIRYALDFTMDIGTPVHAAREGLVIEVKEDSNAGGVGEKYKDAGNYVEIYHADGTFAIYMHLKLSGSVVKPGDTVEAGQLIGYSGNTGYSSGPHLHFAVSIPVIKGMETIPVQFLNYDSTAVSAEQGKYYYSTHPGEPPFTVRLGENISDSDYRDYAEKIKQNNKIEICTETVDSKVLVFVRNGFKSAKQVTVNFTLTNMAASKTIPCTLKAPPLTESYLLFIERAESSEAWKFTYKLSYMNVK